MAERDSFVTVADGDQLNDGFFNDIQRALQEVTWINTNTSATQTPATWSDVLSTATPAANKANQKAFVEAQVTFNTGAAGNVVRLYDSSGSVSLDSTSGGANSRAHFLAGEVTLTNIGDTKTMKVQIQGDGSNSTQVNSSLLKCTLLPETA